MARWGFVAGSLELAGIHLSDAVNDQLERLKKPQMR